MNASDGQDEGSQLDEAIRFCALYEAELLVELMLRFWGHPKADERDFRNHLLDSTTEVLQRSQRGERFLTDIRPRDMNFVAALWYVEWCQSAAGDDPDTTERREWLEHVRRSIPACFCSPDDLVEP